MKYRYIGQNIKSHEAETKAGKLAAKIYKLDGSGLNFPFVFYQKGNVLRLNTRFDYMNDKGYYDGSILVIAWFNITKKEFLSIKCKNTGKYSGTQDYLEEVFSEI